MPKYMFHGSYTLEGVKGLLKEGGSGRRKAAEELVKSLGGRVESYNFAFGGSDFYLIAELPDAASAAAGSLTASSAGGVRISTVVLITPEEMDAAAKKHPSYRAPGTAARKAR
jgi:uncharacterized protein with GYD domain